MNNLEYKKMFGEWSVEWINTDYAYDIEALIFHRPNDGHHNHTDCDKMLTCNQCGEKPPGNVIEHAKRVSFMTKMLRRKMGE